MAISEMRLGVFIIVVLMILFAYSPNVESKGGGGSYGGGSSYSRSSFSRGGRGGGSSSSSWGKSYGGYKSKSSNGYKSKSGGSVKSFAKKHWKKAVAFGAGAYIGYKAHKVSKKVCKINFLQLFYYNLFSCYNSN